MTKSDPSDPRGLIREAFRIEGITEADCRTIFFDWALGMEPETVKGHLNLLIARYAAEPADHPMQAVLREGQAGAAAPKRRGGRRRITPG
ncbi:hypothetical protein [Oceanomicrobium pacificus]|uniref:Uncharacterized protein n=1 Tax=Oceanomicrobium pacificus TaxID=2692916 RepID=A0A6B0TU41_9RHOB|nr:hypothetical protein [Oceanomicrobium pacificus]MXU66299.1 hypothetical protein [Oceanomicrobium pacificus]